MSGRGHSSQTASTTNNTKNNFNNPSFRDELFKKMLTTKLDQSCKDEEKNKQSLKMGRESSVQFDPKKSTTDLSVFDQKP